MGNKNISVGRLATVRRGGEPSLLVGRLATVRRGGQPSLLVGRLATVRRGGQPSHAVGRLAPSPTGFLHLGNAWAFLLAWLGARAAGGRVILRMEDIDPDRSRPHFATAIMEDLHWLGLDWDAEYTQSQRNAYYAAALKKLADQGSVYPCYCTRKEVRSLAAAPHVGDAGAPYPGTCRHLSPAERAAREAEGRRATLRLRCPSENEGPRQGDTSTRPPGPANVLLPKELFFDDAIQGPQRMNLAQCGGDFALRRSDGVMAYQLAVVVDDGLMGITQVVRGDDIRISTPRQILLCHLLNFAVPRYAHVPLLLDEGGERLAKRHQSLSLRALRAAGVSPRAVTGFLAALAGLLPRPALCHPQELLPAFSFDRVPPKARHLPPDIRTILSCMAEQ